MRKESEAELVVATRKALIRFKELASNSVKVEVKEHPEGQFLIGISNPECSVSIAHSWGEAWTYHNPNTIDIQLRNKKKHEAYVIFMTECELRFFPELLENAFVVVRKFLADEYVIEKPSRFSLFRKSHAFFGKGLTYSYATQIKYRD